MSKQFDKQPAETLDYFFDFRTWLQGKQDVASEYVVESAPGITVNSHNMNTPGVVQVFVAGGVSGQRYKVSCRLTTAGGRVKESDFMLKVKEG